MIRTTVALGLVGLILLPGCTSRTDSSWHLQIVHDKGGVQSGSFLAIDSKGYPHISYYWIESLWDGQDAGGHTNGIHHLNYAAWNGSEWEIQSVDRSEQDSGHLVLDSRDYPHISYCGDEDILKYAAWNGATWDIRRVDVDTSHVRTGQMALDSSGNPHIAYVDCEPLGSFDERGTEWDYAYELKYAAWDGSSWEIQTVDTGQAGGTGPNLSLALDSSGRPHMSYSLHSVRYGELKYARSYDSGWDIQTVAKRGFFPSLALDSSGYPHISFQDKGVKYATWNGSSWDIQTVAKRGYGPSLALDSSGYPHISFLDKGLKYATWNVSSWDIQTVAKRGYSSSLALDSSGWAHISYRNNRVDLSYATNAPSYRAQTRTKSK